MRSSAHLLLVAALIAVVIAVPVEQSQLNKDACPANPLKAGRHDFKVNFGGIERNYILHVPRNYDNSRNLPLFFAFHGLSNTADQAYVNFGIPEISDSQSVISVVPNGYGQSWNGGDCCPPATRNNIDDIGFVRFLISEVSKKVCVDSRRIYAGGYSNGGFLSHRLACEASDVIRAIGPVAGVLSTENGFVCNPPRPVPMMHFHGTADATVPYALAGPSFNRWKTINGCTGETVVTFKNNTAVCDSYTRCNGGVITTLCTINRGPHAWPGCSYYGKGAPGSPCGCTNATPDIIATVEMWKFFTQWSLSQEVEEEAL